VNIHIRAHLHTKSIGRHCAGNVDARCILSKRIFFDKFPSSKWNKPEWNLSNNNRYNDRKKFWIRLRHRGAISRAILDDPRVLTYRKRTIPKVRKRRGRRARSAVAHRRKLIYLVHTEYQSLYKSFSLSLSSSPRREKIDDPEERIWVSSRRRFTRKLLSLGGYRRRFDVAACPALPWLGLGPASPVMEIAHSVQPHVYHRVEKVKFRLLRAHAKILAHARATCGSTTPRRPRSLPERMARNESRARTYDRAWATEREREAKRD